MFNLTYDNNPCQISVSRLLVRRCLADDVVFEIKWNNALEIFTCHEWCIISAVKNKKAVYGHCRGSSAQQQPKKQTLPLAVAMGAHVSLL